MQKTTKVAGTRVISFDQNFESQQTLSADRPQRLGYEGSQVFCRPFENTVSDRTGSCKRPGIVRKRDFYISRPANVIIIIIFINEFYGGGSSPHQTPRTAKRELVADFKRTGALVVRITERRPTQATPLLSQTLRTNGQICN